MTARRLAAKAELRELGHGWIVDLVEAAPAPCTWSARLDPAGVEVRAELDRHGVSHSARRVLQLAELDAFSADYLAIDHVQRQLEEMSAAVLKLAEDHEAAVASRRALRGTRGIL